MYGYDKYRGPFVFNHMSFFNDGIYQYKSNLWSKISKYSNTNMIPVIAYHSSKPDMDNSFSEKKREIKEDLKESLDKIEKEKEMRDTYLSEIDKDLLDRYKQIQGLRNGIAVAFAEAERCLGCNMKIPPQIYNEAVRAEKLVSCPNCHRILVIKPVNERAEKEA